MLRKYYYYEACTFKHTYILYIKILPSSFIGSICVFMPSEYSFIGIRWQVWNHKYTYFVLHIHVCPCRQQGYNTFSMAKPSCTIKCSLTVLRRIGDIESNLVQINIHTCILSYIHFYYSNTWICSLVLSIVYSIIDINYNASIYCALLLMFIYSSS
jgi:hypothetical protein